MGINKLERVMWRLRQLRKDAEVNKLCFTNLELKRAIMYECGTDDRTYYKNRKALKELGWIKRKGPKRILVTEKDILDS